MLSKLKHLILFLVVMLLAVLPSMPVFALTTTTVYVNATPYFLSFTVFPGSWGVNATGSPPAITPSTTYYSSNVGEMTVPSDPVVNTECRFLITNTSTVVTDITINWANFTGGDAMTNSNTGTAGANSFGGWSYFSGRNYSNQKEIVKATSSNIAYSSLAATTNIKFGLTILTQTGAWASAANTSSIVTITMSGN